MAELTDDQMVKIPAIVARLYLSAALDEAERRAKFEIEQIFAQMRSTFLADLKGDQPLQLLLQGEQLLRQQVADGQRCAICQHETKFHWDADNHERGRPGCHGSKTCKCQRTPDEIVAAGGR